MIDKSMIRRSLQPSYKNTTGDFMERSIIRFIRPIAFAMITFVSCYYLTGSLFVSGITSLIPLLLGWVGVFESFAYAVAALLFISAVVWAVTPIETKQFISRNVDTATKELAEQLPAQKPQE